MVCQSFAKNMGLYGERVGCFSIVCDSAEEATKVTSQVKQRVLRTLWSFPPVYGARIAARILSTPRLKDLWYEDLLVMSGRIAEMRRQLYDALVANGTPSPTGTWDHVITQIGMFAFTGLNTEHCTRLLEDHHVGIKSHPHRNLISRAGTVQTMEYSLTTVLSEGLMVGLPVCFQVYLTPDGRMAICGLRSTTVPIVAKAMDIVLRGDASLAAKL